MTTANDRDVIRRASALMRQRAQNVRTNAAEPDQWFGVEELTDALTWGDQAEMSDPDADAQHIASWSPTVAIAVSVLLDGLSSDHWDFRHDEALTVARAYLGEDSTP